MVGSIIAKLPLMNRAGRATLVQAVLSAMHVHLLIAINVTKWFIVGIS
jgi:hypothetical protein